MTLILRILGYILLVALALLLVTLAIPVEMWRTGEQPRPALALQPYGTTPELPGRVWVDTDAACGEGPRADPDDCFALLALSAQPTRSIFGISTVFGNSELERTTSVTEELVDQIDWGGRTPPPVYRGARRPIEPAGGADVADAHLGFHSVCPGVD